MNRLDIQGKTYDILVEHLGVERESITEKSRLADDLGADSLDQLELVMTLEDEFGIEIPDDDVDQIKTVRELIDYVEKKAA